MKRLTAALYYLALVLFCILPLPLSLLLDPYLDHTNRENRVLAGAPSLASGKLSEFPSEFNAFFTDHLPYKNELALLGGLMDYRVFRGSAGGSVAGGDEGFLCYKGSQLNGEHRVADYLGTSLYTEEEASEIARRFTEARDYLKEQGTDFVVLLAPNKERVYSDYMPKSLGQVSFHCRYYQVKELLENAGIKVFAPLQVIRDYREEHPEKPMYFRFDTHWTRLGAYLAAKELDQYLGVSMPSLTELPLAEGEPFSEDLANQMGLSGILQDVPVYNPYGYSPYQLEVQVNDLVTEMKGCSSIDNGKGLLLIGDSFSTLMFPYVACNFERSRMVIYYDQNEQVLREASPDVVVFEIVERYLGNLTRFSILDGIERKYSTR